MLFLNRTILNKCYMFELTKLCQFYSTNLAKLGCSFLEHKKKHAGSEIYLKKIGGRLEKDYIPWGEEQENYLDIA